MIQPLPVIVPGPDNELTTQSAYPQVYYPIIADFATTAATASYTMVSGSLGYWGSWHCTNTQTASLTATPYPVKVNTIIGQRGFYISGSNGTTSGSAIVVPETSAYDFQFSLQLHHDGGGGSGHTVDIWFRVNGNDVPWSNTKVCVQPNYPFVVAAWNFMDTFDKGDKLELMWATDNVDIMIHSYPISAYAPAIPPAIFTIQQV